MRMEHIHMASKLSSRALKMRVVGPEPGPGCSGCPSHGSRSCHSGASDAQARTHVHYYVFGLELNIKNLTELASFMKQEVEKRRVISNNKYTNETEKSKLRIGGRMRVPVVLREADAPP
ncbi:hypothetical protein Salat_1754000 [Sesamum alatum]|uniref:Uncharacterized protein n=1 Tax=Sesamum alatum TaxID=300844 RepID=A0AAE2CKK9_9LAMI|nr:hypothetical protein Salat_1754000 [Sesamum alatum]